MTSATDQEGLALESEANDHPAITTSSPWAGWWTEETD
jgi:hypothetical protein